MTVFQQEGQSEINQQLKAFEEALFKKQPSDGWFVSFKDLLPRAEVV